jgi:hypothetical protein
MLPMRGYGYGASQIRRQKRTFLTRWNADWVKVPIVETIQRVICVTSNRVFVGTPLCE